MIARVTGGALVGVLLAVSTAGAATDFCKLEAVVHVDGSVILDSRRFADRNELRAYLVQYKRRFPKCIMTFKADQGVPVATITSIARTVHDAGFATMGFLTEPRAVP